MSDLRKVGPDGQRISFTCRNRRFETADFGATHGTLGEALGSVDGQALYLHEDGGSLWLEHVRDHRDEIDGLYWLMWYDRRGVPLTPASGVLGREELAEIGRRLIRQFVP